MVERNGLMQRLCAMVERNFWTQWLDVMVERNRTFTLSQKPPCHYRTTVSPLNSHKR